MPRTLKPGERHRVHPSLEIVQHEGFYREWEISSGGARHGGYTVRGVYEVPEKAEVAPEPKAPQEYEYSAERQFALKRAIKRRLEDRRQGRF